MGNWNMTSNIAGTRPTYLIVKWRVYDGTIASRSDGSEERKLCIAL